MPPPSQCGNLAEYYNRSEHLLSIGARMEEQTGSENRAKAKLWKQRDAQTAPELEGVPHNDLKIHMKSVIHNYWLSKWRNSRTKLKEIKNDIKPWRNTLHQRKEQVMITRLRTGHTKYTHEHLLTGEEEKKYDMCQVPVSVKHLLSESPKFVEQR
ncbi:hypothetical protein JTB14_019310 [Gonioctena quinquepunctata]|nr:hypothetical protein JTB14_019310 [Gonioctena quinquepunctata]